jgi:hypothetical protein
LARSRRPSSISRGSRLRRSSKLESKLTRLGFLLA